MKQHRTLWLGGGAVVVVAALLVFASPSAHASFFQDFLHNLFGVGSSTPNVQTSPAPEYRAPVDYEQHIIDAVQQASPSVVSIVISKNVPIIENCPVNPFGDLPPEFQQFFGNVQFSQPCQKGTKLQEVGGGSGFIISGDGLILTNKHVVQDTNASYTVFTNDGKKYSAKVVARDSVQDLAVVKIEAPAGGLPVITLGDSDSIKLGQTAIAIGNALGEFRNTVSVGIISGLSRKITAGEQSGFEEELKGIIQTDAAINLGNSGGPLLNLRGEVIGINTATAEGAQNIGFALPINLAKRDINSVKATGKIQTPFLGIRYVLNSSDIAKRDKLPTDKGVIVRGGAGGPAVIPQSPAANAGIQAGDIIIAINGRTVDADHTPAELLQSFSVGDTVSITLLHAGKEMTVSVTLAERKI